jgi:pimeloyl-ACP methyl ester carboxylesterase
MVTLTEIEVGARPSRAWVGGEGETILLVHGGWGGAEMHWSRVWEPLARRFRVIAPELPGIGDRAQPGLASFDAYADWLVQLLGSLRVPRAWCVGNSFGAAVVWQLSARLEARCRGVVLVNGMAPFVVPSLVRRAFSTTPVRQLITRAYRKAAFSPPVVQRGAYADPSLVPAELTRVLADPPRAHMRRISGSRQGRALALWPRRCHSLSGCFVASSSPIVCFIARSLRRPEALDARPTRLRRAVAVTARASASEAALAVIELLAGSPTRSPAPS